MLERALGDLLQASADAQSFDTAVRESRPSHRPQTVGNDKLLEVFASVESVLSDTLDAAELELSDPTATVSFRTYRSYARGHAHELHAAAEKRTIGYLDDGIVYIEISQPVNARECAPAYLYDTAVVRHHARFATADQPSLRYVDKAVAFRAVSGIALRYRDALERIAKIERRLCLTYLDERRR